MDRRVQRTRDTLHRALISLMMEKGFEAVTVQHILDRANVGRSTFYAHYTGKDDLFRAGFKNLRRELEAVQHVALHGPQRRRFGFSLALFEHANGHRRLYHALVGRRSAAMVMNELRNLFADLVRSDLKALPPAPELRRLPNAALVQFVAGSLISILAWWLEDRSALPPAEADAVFRRLALAALGERELGVAGRAE
jgi:AcrR family transcriptional regulator